MNRESTIYRYKNVLRFLSKGNSFSVKKKL